MKKNSQSFFSRQLSHKFFFALATLALFTLPARSQTWTGEGGGNWGTNSSWSANVTFGNSTDLTFSAANANASSTSTPAFLGATRTIRSLNFDANADSDIFIRLTQTIDSTARNLTFQAASGSTNVTVASGATGNYTIGLSSGNLILGSDLLIDHNGTGSLTIDRPITGTGFGITKNGTGLPTLSGTNTFTGGFTLNAGQLNINNAQALGNATPGAFVINGGTIDNTSAGNLTLGAKPLTINTDFTFISTQSLNGSKTYTGATTIGSSNGTNAGTLHFSGSGTISNAATTIYCGTLPQSKS